MGLRDKIKSKIKKALDNFSGEHSSEAPKDRTPYQRGTEDENTELKLWPNPVRNQINILSEEHIRDIKLYDQLMREINPKGYATGTNQYVLDLSGLKRGIYHLRINGKNVRARVLKL